MLLLFVGVAPAAACRRGVELLLAHELCSLTLSLSSWIMLCMLETWFSNVVTRSRAAWFRARAASKASGGATRVPFIPVMVELGSGLEASPRTFLVTDIGGPETVGAIAETNVPDIIVSAILTSSPLGANALPVLSTN